MTHISIYHIKPCWRSGSDGSENISISGASKAKKQWRIARDADET